MARYLLFLALFLSVLCGAGSGVLALRYWHYYESDEQGLLRYQIGKLARLDGVDTVLVGDSTLGNAIDVATFDHLAGTHSLALPLTGLHGYAGTLAMMTRALEKNPLIRRFVIFQSPDLMLRKTEYDGAFFTLERWPGDLPPHIRWGLMTTALSRLTEYAQVPDTLDKAARTVLTGTPWPRFAGTGDYVPQVIKGTFVLNRQELSAASINPDKEVFLWEISRLCRTSHLSCVYLHGPLHTSLVNASAPAFTAIDTIITRTGLHLVCPKPLPLQPDQVGDSDDHVHPAWRTAATAYYARVLQQVWSGENVMCDSGLTNNPN